MRLVDFSIRATIGLSLYSMVTTVNCADVKRGQMLYENHCTQCHESRMHILARRTVSTMTDVRFQIDRWQQELRLNWDNEDINDVLGFLDTRYYQFKRQP